MHLLGARYHSRVILGVLAGSFNPPTVAHVQLLEAAKPHVDELLCVVPQVLPHKEFHGATLEQRVALLAALGYPVEVSGKGLLFEIAEELRSRGRLLFLCGTDAAHRIVTWDYGRPEPIEVILAGVEMLVAPRGGDYQAPPPLRQNVRKLEIGDDFHEVSSSEVRERILRGEAWRHLVPPTIWREVEAIYS